MEEVGDRAMLFAAADEPMLLKLDREELKEEEEEEEVTVFTMICLGPSCVRTMPLLAIGRFFCLASCC